MTREEAIKTIRLTCPKISDSECDFETAMRFLIPELRESEDERIIEEIKFAIMQMRSEREDTKQRCLDWLEKQKYNRMKPVYDNQDSFESALEKAWKDYNDSGARTVDGCEDDYVEYAHAKGFREGYLFGIKKQKEPVIDKEGMYYYLGGKFIYCGYPATEENPYDFAMSQQEKQKEQPTNEEMLRTLRAEYEKGVADTIAKYEQKEQKPAWSEEDENAMKYLHELISWGYAEKFMDAQTAHDMRKWVNEHLRPQPKVEWSEDVKKTLDEVSHILIGLNYKQVAKDYKQAIEKLLYSRPQWKPSEEQMSALHTAVYLEEMQFYGGLKDKLRDLYEQLKKL